MCMSRQKVTKSFKRFPTVHDDRLNGYGIKRDDSPLIYGMFFYFYIMLLYKSQNSGSGSGCIRCWTERYSAAGRGRKDYLVVVKVASYNLVSEGFR